MDYEYFRFLIYQANGCLMKGNSGQQLLDITHSGGSTLLRGAEASGDSLAILSNSTNLYPHIELTGNSTLKITAYDTVTFNQQTTVMSRIDYSSNVTTITGGNVSADDLKLKANSVDNYPYINLIGNLYPEIYSTNADLLKIYYQSTRGFNFNYASNLSTMTGSTASGDDLKIIANSTDTYPFILITGNNNIDLEMTAGGFVKHKFNNYEGFRFQNSSNVSTIEGGVTSGDDLKLKCGSADTHPYINLEGAGDIIIDLPSAKSLIFKEAGTEFGSIQEGTDLILNTASNKNLYLAPNGSGLVKLGTHNAIAAETVTGYITIKDSGGTDRKIAVVS